MSVRACPALREPLGRLALGVALCLLGGVAASRADEPSHFLDRIRDTPLGSISLDARLRYEFADIDGLDDAHANTLRTRLGFRTKAWKGLSAFVELENIVAADDAAYFDGVSKPNGESIVADPEDTELNQFYLRYQNPEWGLGASGGRQRIVLDDARFVGNVGWRQNEQTYDAIFLEAPLGLDGLSARYGYVWEVRRIFGDQGPSKRRDFESDSHLVGVSYSGIEGMKLTAFAYLLDFDNSPGNSSSSYGIRVSGTRPLGTGLKLGYLGSYAFQTDAGSNPASYDANYYMAEGSLASDSLGAIALGYEVLGSDGGRARFVTPLATVHKFNGWADAFLDNGGPKGLRDAYVSFSPKMPWGLGGKLVYHQFWSDEGSDALGNEFDFVLSKAITKHVMVLAKAAFFNGRSGGPADRVRFWLQTRLKF